MYAPEWVTIKQGTGSELNLGDIYISRHRTKQLDEVTVTGTRVMFYHKGDTLVYNAEAFITPEGSMLDELLKKMPGMEFRNGELYNNGHKIDNLLLNGKYLFNGKKELMLENLGAYTVKEIAVYKKRTRMGELLNMNTGKETRVVDVRLKRTYWQGWTVNADGGAGTHDRYMAKLFGMWFSENVSLTAYAGLNNISDQNAPGKDDKPWNPAAMATNSGLTARKNGGLTYVANGFANKWELKGNVDATHLSTDKDLYEAQEIGQQKPTFRYRWDMVRNKSLQVSTSHNYFTKLGNWGNLTVNPELRYRNEEKGTSQLSASFREEMKEISRQTVLRIYSDSTGMEKALMNRMHDENSSLFHGIDTRGTAALNIKLQEGENASALTVNSTGEYKRLTDDYFSRYVTLYNLGESFMKTGAHRYYKQYPNSNLKWTGGIGAFKYTDWARLPLNYSFEYRKSERTSDIYMLSQGAEVVESDERPLTEKPQGSEQDGMALGDMSYQYVETEQKHEITSNPYLKRMIHFGRGHLVSLNTRASVTINHRKLHFNYGYEPANVVRNDVLPDITLGAQYYKTESRWGAYLSLRYWDYEVEMAELVTIPSKMPTITGTGNPDLKNRRFYSASLNVSDRMGLVGGVGQRQNTIMANFRYSARDILSVHSIDPLGNESYSPVNVSGNMNGTLNYYHVHAFGRRNQFDMSLNTHMNYSKLVGTSSVIGLEEYGIDQSVATNWTEDMMTVGLHGSAKVERYDYRKEYYNDFTGVTLTYGAKGTLKLPMGWGLSSSIMMYTRRGFMDDRLNTTDAVWNVRLSKSMLKGKLVFLADGYDLLRQLTNVSYTINTYARTEMVYNVIPSYVMVHVYWRWSKKPTNKK